MDSFRDEYRMFRQLIRDNGIRFFERSFKAGRPCSSAAKAALRAAVYADYSKRRVGLAKVDREFSLIRIQQDARRWGQSVETRQANQRSLLRARCAYF